ncbi:MAG: transglutaminase domain-containing protein [Velocimicrobium sp.]
MKKLLFKALLAIALVLPCTSIHAAVKVEKPKVKVLYVVNKEDWYVQINHRNPKAVIYYSDKNKKITAKSAHVKAGSKIKTSIKMENGGLYVQACVGKNKSSVVKISVGKMIEKKYNKDVTSTVADITKGLTIDLDKAVAIYQWFGESMKYGERTTAHDMFYSHHGVCQETAELYAYMCKLAGVECYAVTNDEVDYSYSDNHAWCHLIIDGKIQVVDPTYATCTWDIGGTYFILNNVVDFVKTDKYDLSSTNCYLNGMLGHEMASMLFSEPNTTITRSKDHYTIVMSGVDDEGCSYYLRYELNFDKAEDTWHIEQFDKDGNPVED